MSAQKERSRGHARDGERDSGMLDADRRSLRQAATLRRLLLSDSAVYPPERLRRAHRYVHEIAANWNLVVLNANEGHPCPGVQPQLVRITPYRSGGEDLRQGPVFGAWMDSVPGAEALSPRGSTARRKFGGFLADDLRRVYHDVPHSNSFLSLLPDYVTLDWFIPLSLERTRLVFDLYVDRDEADPAVDAMEF